MDALANLSLQQLLPIGLAALGLATFVGVLLTARRPMPAAARVFRKRLGMAGLFVAVGAGALYVVLAAPVEPQMGARPVAAAADAGSGGAAEDEADSARRFSSGKLPALALEAPDGWTLALDKAGRKLTATGDNARLLVSTAILTETVDAEALLAKLAETQRTLGFEVGDTFSDKIGDLPAAGVLATGPARSVCIWIVKRDTHLASSLICTSEGKQSARDACRAPLARLRWRSPAP